MAFIKKVLLSILLASPLYAQNVTVINSTSDPVNISGSITVGTHGVTEQGPWYIIVSSFPNIQTVQVNNSSFTVSGSSLTTNVNNFPASYPVTGTFFPTVQPIQQSGVIGTSSTIVNVTTTTNVGPLVVTNSSWTVAQLGVWNVIIASFPSVQSVQPFGVWGTTVSFPSPQNVQVNNSSFSVLGSTVSVSGTVNANIITAIPAGTNIIGFVSGSTVSVLSPSIVMVSSLSNTAYSGITDSITATANQYNYITSIEITEISTYTLVSPVLGVTCTTFNMSGSPSFLFDPIHQSTTNAWRFLTFYPPLKASAFGTPALITCPSVSGVRWNINVSYYNGP